MVNLSTIYIWLFISLYRKVYNAKKRFDANIQKPHTYIIYAWIRDSKCDNSYNVMNIEYKYHHFNLASVNESFNININLLIITNNMLILKIFCNKLKFKTCIIIFELWSTIIVFKFYYMYNIVIPIWN